MADYTFDNTDFISPEIDPYALQLIIAQQLPTIQYINKETTGEEFTIVIHFSGTLSVEDEAILTDIITSYIEHTYDNIYVKISDLKTAGTNGGTLTALTWQPRVLNTIVGDQNFCTLEDNQFTIIAGRYELTATSCANSVLNHQLRLYNITDSITVDISTNGYTADTNNYLQIHTIIDITATKTYELQHNCSVTVANYGAGKASGFGIDELYSEVFIKLL